MASEEKYLASDSSKSQDTDIKDITYNEHTLTIAQLEEKWNLKIKEVSKILHCLAVFVSINLYVMFTVSISNHVFSINAS